MGTPLRLLSRSSKGGPVMRAAQTRRWLLSLSITLGSPSVVAQGEAISAPLPTSLKACSALAERFPELSPEERLGALGRAAQGLVAGKPWQATFGSFITAAKWQEAVWLLNQNNERAVGDDLEWGLRCYLAEAPLESSAPLGGGATTTERVRFGNGISAVFKPENGNLSSNIASEVGAYIIDRLLRADLVPVTIERQSPLHDNMRGSLQYFVADAILAKDLPEGVRGKPNSMAFFDRLVKNIDRHRENFLYLPSLSKVVAIDNGWCLRAGNFFAKVKALWVDKREASEKTYQFTHTTEPPPALKARLGELSEDDFRTSLGGVVSPSAIERLLKRRARLLRL